MTYALVNCNDSPCTPRHGESLDTMWVTQTGFWRTPQSLLWLTTLEIWPTCESKNWRTYDRQTLTYDLHMTCKWLTQVTHPLKKWQLTHHDAHVGHCSDRHIKNNDAHVSQFFVDNDPPLTHLCQGVQGESPLQLTSALTLVFSVAHGIRCAVSAPFSIILTPWIMLKQHILCFYVLNSSHQIFW